MKLSLKSLLMIVHMGYACVNSLSYQQEGDVASPGQEGIGVNRRDHVDPKVDVLRRVGESTVGNVRDGLAAQ